MTENLNTEKEKDLIQRIINGKKLQYGDANLFLKNILSAIIISDVGEEEEQKIAVVSCSPDVYRSGGVGFGFLKHRYHTLSTIGFSTANKV